MQAINMLVTNIEDFGFFRCHWSTAGGWYALLRRCAYLVPSIIGEDWIFRSHSVIVLLTLPKFCPCRESSGGL